MMKRPCNAYAAFDISPRAKELVRVAEEQLAPVFAGIEEIEYQNQAKVLHALQRERIALHHFAPTTGYGYDDIGRDSLDRVFAYALDAEDALVRPHLVSGTHAIFTALSGLLEPGDVMLSATGSPYDTLEKAIGISGDEYGSLRRQGIKYEEVPLMPEGKLNVGGILEALARTDASVAYFQRSRGYSWRNALLPETDLAPAFEAVRRMKPGCTIVVDNCYGEFTRTAEPTAFGADVEIGSLIKNPGGGIAPTGCYIAGTHACIERIAQRLTVPGMGREVGSYAGSYAPFYQGIFLAPHTTAESLKTAVLFARVFENCGMETLPASDAARSDIVQSLRFASREALIAFCRSIQAAAPVDSFVVPEPWDMPGYTSQVIMAAGAFVQGSSIELSADAPIKAPYTAYVQGGLTYGHGRLGVMLALDALLKLNICG